MANIKLILSYDGTNYLGWQKTAEGKSIEETLENALFQLLRTPCTLQAASRTDAGVHARGQVVNFFAAAPPPLRSLNAVLPRDISVISQEIVPDSFHPTVDAKGKEYHYHLSCCPVQLPFERTQAWHIPTPLDLDAMRKAAKLLTGTHDFSAFCNERQLSKVDPIKTIFNINIEPERIVISGNHFLYKMVRNIVGTLVYVGSGKIAVNAVLEILKSRDRKKAGVTAPSHGLVLHKVFYDITQ